MTRKILHLDLDAFFCAVEELHDPSLKGQPFAVGGRADLRGVVASCSYPARAYGVRSAMPMHKAKALCPPLILVGWNHRDYRDYSRQVMDIVRQLSPLVERLSIDEAFIDVSEADDAPEFIAADLQSRINSEVGLPCSLGVAANKLVAKIANNIGKASAQTGDYPNAITVVNPGDEREFLAPLDARELWGVGPKTAEKLRGLGITTIGEIAATPAEVLGERFGKLGWELAERSQGQDTRPVTTERETKSVSKETTFSPAIYDEAQLKNTLRKLCEGVSRSLVAKELEGRTVTLKLRWHDFTTITRQSSFQHVFNDADEIYHAAEAIFDAHFSPDVPVRLIGVGVSGFAHGEPRQLTLWEM